MDNKKKATAKRIFALLFTGQIARFLLILCIPIVSLRL